MKITIDIDEMTLRKLLGRAVRPRGNAPLDVLRRLSKRRRQRKAMEALEGVGWYGDLDAIREGRDWKFSEESH